MVIWTSRLMSSIVHEHFIPLSKGTIEVVPFISVINLVYAMYLLLFYRLHVVPPGGKIGLP